MRKIFTAICFLCVSQLALSQGIEKAEYFFDTDPGTGNGIIIPMTSPNDTVNFTAMIPLNSLSAGFHILAIRVWDNVDSTWSMFECRGFYIGIVDSELSEITSGEYFFDTDPGTGNGFPLSLVSPPILNDTLIAAINALPIGNHKVGIRFKNANGTWTMPEFKSFNVCTSYGPKSYMDYQVEQNKVFFTNRSTYADSTKWLFGDTTSDTVLNPIKTYAAAGNYTVKLITKNLCGKDTLVTIVPVNGIQRINGNKGSKGGVVTVFIDGNGFTGSTVVKLRKGNLDVLPAFKQLISINRINAFFDFNTADTGVYDVIANITGGILDTIKNGYRITDFKPAQISIAGASGPHFTRPGSMYRNFLLQNQGTEDGIMVPFVVRMGYMDFVGFPQLNCRDSVPDLTHRGIFENAFQYLAGNGIGADVMNSQHIDIGTKTQIVAMYRVRVPASSNSLVNIKINNAGAQMWYEMGAMLYQPVYKSRIVYGDTMSSVRDCMNSFLKKAVKRNLAVTIDNNAWNTCFNVAYDTLTGTIKQMSNDLSLSDQDIPMKAVFSALLVKMAQCGSSGMPATLTAQSFRKIIRDVTYNWLFWENLDSIGRPCIDTTETVTFNFNRQSASQVNTSVNNRVNEDENPCPGLSGFPEMLDQCLPFLKACGLAGDMENADNALVVAGGKKLFHKIQGPFDNACKLNSGSVFCEKMCEGNSSDPNVKYGPGDNHTSKHINTVLDNSYSIFFENMASAPANAAYVEITDTLDKNVFDMSSFQSGRFGWGDSVVYIEANRKDYSLLKDLRPQHPNKLRVDIRLDTATGIARWKFFTLDTATLQLTPDPLQGFLPPNTDGTRGIGFVSFSIKPKSGVTSGTVIDNKATIIFDNNAPLATPVWQHIIDTTRPVSQVNTLPAAVSTNNFVVDWQGTDAHAGIRYYSIYFSVNDSLFKKWKSFTTAVTDTFHGQFNKTYKFYSIAVDRANNFELAPDDPIANPDAFTTPTIPLPLHFLSFTATKMTTPDRSQLEWKTDNESNTFYFDIERSIDGSRFERLGGTAAMNLPSVHEYTYTDHSPQHGINYYRLKQVDRDGRFTYSAVVMVNFDNKQQLAVYPLPATETVTLFGAVKGSTVQLIDVSGKVIRQFNTTTADVEIINIVTLPAGLYLLKVSSGNKYETIKIVKTK